MLISLIILPGTGQEDVPMAEGSTLAALVSMRNLQGRQLTVDGQMVPTSQYSSFVLLSGQEVGALAPVKGA